MSQENCSLQLDAYQCTQSKCYVAVVRPRSQTLSGNTKHATVSLTHRLRGAGRLVSASVSSSG